MTSNELGLLKRCSKKMAGPILEVGSRVIHARSRGPRQFFDSSIDYLGVDLELATGVDRIHNMEWPIRQKFGSVICCSVLEHCERPWLVAANIESALDRGGHLFVSAPFVWRHHDYPGDYWRFSAEAFKILFPSVEWEFLKYASKKTKTLWDKYIDLSNIDKDSRVDGEAAVAMTIGFGQKT